MTPFHRKIFLSFSILLPLLILWAFSGCSVLSRNPAGPAATVTVTVTITETVIRTAAPTPIPTATVAETLITPFGEEYLPGGNASDIKGHPESGKIKALLEKRIITAFKDGSFGPDKPVTRGDYLLWLYNAGGRKTPLSFHNKPTYPDLPPSHWLYPLVEGMIQVGGLKGYPDKTFRPDKPLTREDWCMMSAFFAADPQMIIESVDTFPDQFKLAKYNDSTKISKSARKFVEYACSAAWTEKTFGKPMRKIPFSPQKPVTRAEAAKWIFQFEKTLKIY